jgi:sugar lactone lactonase YvrE
MTLSVMIGSTPGYSGDGGPAGLAKLDHPSSLVFGEDGNTYISDQANQVVRMVDVNGDITTFAGNGNKGYRDGPGDMAEFSFPTGPGALPGGRIGWAHHPYGILVADTENHRIRFINTETREVFTVAGTGQPGYSGDDGPAINAQLNSPTDVYMSDDHEIFVADSKNHVIRKINAVGHIETVAGTGTPGDSPNGTPAVSARLNTPSGLHFDEATRVLYIADTYNHQISKVKLKR